MNRYPPHHNDRFTNLGEVLMWIVVLMAMMILFHHVRLAQLSYRGHRLVGDE